MDDVLISKAAAIDALKRAAYWQDAERKIAELPAVDAVPVVRCKDCKHRPNIPDIDVITAVDLKFPDYCCPLRCEDGYYNQYLGDDWYCANGEREKDE